MLRYLHDLWAFATLHRVWIPAAIGGAAGGLVALAGRTLLVAVWSVALSLLTPRSSSPSVQAPPAHAQAPTDPPQARARRVR